VVPEQRCLELTLVGDLSAGMSDCRARGELHDPGPAAEILVAAFTLLALGTTRSRNFLAV
jgi:hypothetical protein